MTPLAVLSTSMVTGVGWSAKSSCAAIRVGITGFVETKFMYDGEFIQGCSVDFEIPYRGRRKLLEMAAIAVEDATASLVADGSASVRLPLLLCLSEPDRPGRFSGLDQTLIHDISERTGQRFHEESCVIAEGRTSGVQALSRARKIMDHNPQIRRVIVCGVDTLLVTSTLNHYYAQRRLLTADNSDGFIPGEAACAVVLGSSTDKSEPFIGVTGLGFGEEPVTIGSEEPLRADGLVAAIKNAMNDARVTFPQLAYRLTDNSGEQYGYKEAALAIARTVRPIKPEFEIQHPADCIGEVGAATVPALLATSNIAELKGYAPGRFMGDGVLCHVSADGPPRAAFIIRALRQLSEKRMTAS
jgi:3-oxoacyl-[acyl-carrier-protein] synthase I